MKTRILLFLMALALPLVASADPVEINGIYYNLIEKAKVAEVAPHPEGAYGYKMKEVTIPDQVTYDGTTYDVTKIGEQAFFEAAYTEVVVIGNNVTTIGNHAFSSCKKLNSVTIGDRVESIENNAFSSCKLISSVTLPNSLKYIGTQAFRLCETLASINFPEGLETIDFNAFEGTALTSIVLPNSVTRLWSGSFRDCIYLTSAKLSENITILPGGVFEGCSSLESIIIPAKVTEMTNMVFRDCSKMSFVAILGQVTSIDELAFSGCSELTDFYCYSEDTPALGADVFRDSYVGYATLHVPAGSISKYKAANQWKDFGNIVALKEGDPGYGNPQPETEPYVVYNNGTQTFYCDNQRSSREGTTYDLNGESQIPEWHANRASITKAVFDASFANARPVTTFYWFYQCTNLTEIQGLSYLNTNEVTNMDYMFDGCSGLTSLDVSNSTCTVGIPNQLAIL